MKINNLLPKVFVVFMSILALASCEEDFNSIGSGIIGDQEIDLILDDTKTIVSYSRKIQPVQSNGLPYNLLGVYNDPVFGKSKTELLSQVILEDTDPIFGDCTVLDSVVLYIPYFSSSEVVDDETTYTLDSIYGDGRMNIRIYESEYFLRDFDPDSGFEDPQNYYVNQGPTFRSFRGQWIQTIFDYKPKNEAYVVISTDTTEEGEFERETVAPGIRVKLPTDFFFEKIIEKEGSPELINNNNFRDYFRGLYFEVEAINNDGSLIAFPLIGDDSNIANDAKITLHYSAKTLNEGETCEETEEEFFNGTLNLLFAANNVNIIENELEPNISSALLNANNTQGDERLYVRGGDGIISIIELFGEDLDDNGVADELEDLREKEWLINEANLIFYVDQDQVQGGSAEPERIMIYDVINGRLLRDYNFDTSSSDSAVDAITEHLGRLVRGSDEHGDYYKIKITNHISDLINRDSTNVALGIVTSQNVLLRDFQDLENIQAPGIETLPVGTVISHEGTVLHGNASNNQDRRLKLQIYYTEPN